MGGGDSSSVSVRISSHSCTLTPFLHCKALLSPAGFLLLPPSSQSTIVTLLACDLLLRDRAHRCSDCLSPPCVSSSPPPSLSFTPFIPVPDILLSSSQRVFQGEREGQGTRRLPETQRKTAAGGGSQGGPVCVCLTPICKSLSLLQSIRIRTSRSPEQPSHTCRFGVCVVTSEHSGQTVCVADALHHLRRLRATGFSSHP